MTSTDPTVDGKHSSLKPRPPLIELDPNEIYTNDSGEEIKIEVCGARERKKCYYKAIDIQVGYNTVDIEELMCNRLSRYRRGKHFEYFLCDRRPELYLTFSDPYRIGWTGRASANPEMSGVTGILYAGNTGSIAECFID